MPTVNNVINAVEPFSATIGGSGVASPTVHGILIGEGGSPYNSLVLTAGQIPIGTTAGDPAGATLTQGTGITITSVSGTITIAANGGSGLTWNTEATSTVAMAINNGYIINNGASLCTLTLPSTAALGSIVAVIGLTASSGLWKIDQNAGQQINFGSAASTSGTGGSVASTLVNDNIFLICTVANTQWAVYSAVGNQTVT